MGIRQLVSLSQSKKTNFRVGEDLDTCSCCPITIKRMVRVGIGIGFWVWGVRECTSRSSVTPASWDFGLIEFISIDVTMQGGQAITPRNCAVRCDHHFWVLQGENGQENSN